MNYSVYPFSYAFVVEKQPIGKLLFHEFCQATNSQYHQCCQFLTKVRTWKNKIKKFHEAYVFDHMHVACFLVCLGYYF